MHASTTSRRARLGLRLFWFYSLLYGAYVAVNAFFPASMEATPWAGVNWAILSGLGLIVVALALAMAYGWLCRERPSDASREERRS